jgi:hypothetical protein
MSNRTIDTITAALLLLAIAIGAWFGAAMQSALVGLVAVAFLGGMGLVLGGLLMYAVGPMSPSVRRFGQPPRD